MTIQMYSSELCSNRSTADRTWSGGIKREVNKEEWNQRRPQRGSDAREESNRMRRSLPKDRVKKAILSRENSLSKAQISQRAWPFHGTAAASSGPKHSVHTREWEKWLWKGQMEPDVKGLVCHPRSLPFFFFLRGMENQAHWRVFK